MAKHPHLDRAVYALRREAHRAQSPIPEDLGRLLAAAVLEALPERSWFAVATKFQLEARAADELRKQGFQVYRPKVFRHPDDEDFLEYGAMDYRIPGYVVVQVDKQQGVFSAIENTKGVESLVYGAHGGDKKALALPPGTVERLRKFEEEDFAHATARKPDPRDDLREGIEVTVDDKDHPVYGNAGILMFLDAKIGKVLIGAMLWEVEAAYLKKVVKPKKAKRKKADAGESDPKNTEQKRAA